MARSLITKTTIAENTTLAVNMTGNRKKISTLGHYLKTSGTDPTEYIYIIERSSLSTGAGRITFISGSTDGNDDFEPGKYSTNRNLNITVTSSTGSTRNQRVIKVAETSRFLDTDDYIKIDPSTHFSTANGSSHACYIGVVHLKRL